MNCTFTFTVSAPTTAQAHVLAALHQAHEKVQTLERELSEFLPNSPVARLNQSPAGEQLPIPLSVLECLKLSREMERVSHGAFDCAIKGARHVHPAFDFNEQTGTGWRCGDNERLSFAAIGKGYALNQVRAILEGEGFTNYLLNAGGSSLVFSGFSAPETPWSWGWAWERDAAGQFQGREMLHVTGEPVAVGVSGTLEQGAHLKDPRSGAAADKSVSALVALPCAARADALSTALFVSGWEEGSSCLTKDREIPALALIDSQRVPAWNARFQKMWGALAGFLFVFFPASLLAASEDIDLSDLGFDDFTPYAVTRDPLWILLPLLSLALVLLHLRKTRKPKRENTK